jgi:transposase InsO family protein
MKDSYPSVSLERFCWLLGLTRQALYKDTWKGKRKSSKEQLVVSEVKNIRREHPAIGTRKLHELLQSFYQQHSIKMGRDALFCTLSDHRLLIRRRKRRVSTTQSHHWLKKYSNLVKGWYPTLPEQLWVSDITYVPCGRQHLYLSLITDAYSHKIMGYHIADTLEAIHCKNALQMALCGRLYPTHNLIHHSDRGIQYCSSSYTELLIENNISISMTESGDPLDNAIAERINGIIKHEYLKHYGPSNLERATQLLKQVVESYNERRPHLSIQMNTPNKVHHQKLQVNRQWKKSKRTSTIVNQLNHL